MVSSRAVPPIASAAVGASPPDEPANTLRPSGSFATRMLQVFEPSFASAPSMVIGSPTSRTPCSSRSASGCWAPHLRTASAGLPAIVLHIEVHPDCGFPHSSFVTAPVSVTGLFISNSAAKEWWAWTGSAAAQRGRRQSESVSLSCAPPDFHRGSSLAPFTPGASRSQRQNVKASKPLA